ncbi:MAG: energy transducer TonB [Proteobacteria bacterium]|nr:energy transducer TonB [Pseudomonadota bacterium]
MRFTKTSIQAVAVTDCKHKPKHVQFMKQWGIPVLFGVLINITLFCMMPGLIRIVPDKPVFDDNLHAVQVIRIKRPDSQVQRKKPKELPKPEKKEIRPTEKNISLSKPLQNKIHLSFELNTKLPVGPQTLSMPSLELFSLNASGLKSAYGIHELDGPLTPLSKIPPIYPMRAKRLSIEGSVSVKFLVDENGLVAHIEILESTPSDIFNKSVIACISRWRFKPGTIEGIPVQTWVETMIRFELENS